MTVPFDKTALDHPQQVQLLESRGLKVEDVPFAIHCLQHINYYRLSAYRFPLTVDGNPDQFLPDATFADLWMLYDFDQTLRRLVLDASKRVEVSIRAHWAHQLGHKYGPFCYEDSSLFANKEEHLRGLARIYNDLASSKEDFVNHFRLKYGLTRPPIWAVCEICSFGLTSRFYQNLRVPADRQEIADAFGLDEKVLASYLNHLTVVRNTAAHHSRLWNRRFGVRFMIPSSKPPALHENFSSEPGSEKKIYNTLTMLLYLLRVIEPNCSVYPRFWRVIDSLEAKYHRHMGIPDNWRQRPLWKAAEPSPPESEDKNKSATISPENPAIPRQNGVKEHRPPSP